MNVRQLAQHLLLPFLFLILLAIVFITFVSLHHTQIALMTYGTAATLIFSAYFSQQLNLPEGYKYYACFISVIVLIISGFVFINDIEEIEEMYTFIPFLYLLILPGTMWPILVSFLLLSAYFPSLENNELVDVIEDGLELIVIATFATIMTYFQQSSLDRMRLFRSESYTDYLTRLPNRKKIMKHMHSLQEQQQAFALIIIDLDSFKSINDQLGHLAGDEMLCLVAKRLEKMGKPYRLWGDEFAFLVCDQDELHQQTDKLTKQIIATEKQPYLLNNKKYYISACVGISFLPDDSNDIEILCSYADLAMYQSKSIGKSAFTYFEKQFIETIARRNELESDLKNAIEKQQLFLLYQPKVDIQSGKIFSAEALLRWLHPKYGLISPFEFIPIAEQNREIIPIGQWVLEQVCIQMSQWKTQYCLENIAVNVSSIQLTEPNFTATVQAILNKSNCEPQWLEIEQTESWLIHDQEYNINILKQLKELGVSLALDDFGTGYSSLSQIARLPLDVLKIDKCFIDNCVSNRDDHMVVRTIIQLGQNLGMKIVAEGVEHEEQRQLLATEQCEYYQGYLFSKPISTIEFETLLKAQ
ncbi:putative bifunctional diguanylate cyclase/phosphodiesterase [Psychromonas hadalis]|uniref:putative bifunctional diguanylate cyclase/phosphodiesterase n=1 Tax=Psychromonas hadalis TaxID=211669 RepID=UPI0003B53838|nr:bifunctional diguanylate cyclase/phosphodiesterase [Psychromonas hadalis]